MNIYKIGVLVLFFTINLACIQDDQFDTPDTTVGAPEINGSIIEINAVLGFLAQAVAAGESEFTFNQDSDNYVQGYVVSSDEAGNFFEELIIQNAPENPTAGIKVLIDENPLFTSFELGRKVYVKLAGLTVAISNGVAGIGVGGGAFIEKIPAPQMDQIILRGTEVEPIVARQVTIDDFSNELENLFIGLTNVQFTRNDVLGENPLTFAGEATDEFDGERLLESCDGGGVIISTSTFADFKGLLLPSGRGSLEGILTRDFFDEFYTININEPSNVVFDPNAERCDPEFISCTTPSGGGTAFFSENFEDISSISDLETAGWTLVNTIGGETLWELGSFSGNNYMQITAFGSGEDNIASWLITPGIAMDATTVEELQFKVQASYDNGRALSVFYAANFLADPTKADWNLLDATIPIGPGGGFGDFQTVGPINVSCLEGTVHFAFLYTGSESGISTRYHIDDVVVKGL